MASGGTNSGQNWQSVLLAEFNKRFSPQATRAALQDGVKFGVAIASENTPVKTGTLKAGNKMRIVSDTEAEMYNDVEYGPFVNDGSSGRPPQPFFDRGAATAAQKIKEACAKL